MGNPSSTSASQLVEEQHRVFKSERKMDEVSHFSEYIPLRIQDYIWLIELTGSVSAMKMKIRRRNRTKRGDEP
ncbi:hypothetical protein DY000_02059018 [Brassica cretica]|uniref:Uncharacterized protein n=1 Tax=Brassica cretica TaxID=69181 RepID=A0ABQ7ASU7_BRACR|nr:hypothetical protein DY000_02059018 [Brassica cretica]